MQYYKIELNDDTLNLLLAKQLDTLSGDSIYLMTHIYERENKLLTTAILITYDKDNKPTWKHIKQKELIKVLDYASKINKLPEQYNKTNKQNTWMYGTHELININGKEYLKQIQRDYKTNKKVSETIKEVITSGMNK
jgi:hypothetical protein